MKVDTRKTVPIRKTLIQSKCKVESTYININPEDDGPIIGVTPSKQLINLNENALKIYLVL